jgi:hypothetical protein
MKRTISTSSLMIALFGSVACGGGGASSLRLVPDSATVVGGIDVVGLRKSSIWASASEGIAKTEGKEVLDAAAACSVGLAEIERVTFGFDPGTEDFAVVIDADGIGKPAALDCLDQQITAKDGSAPWKREEKDGRVARMMADGKIVYVASDSAIVFVSKAWSSGERDLIDGKGRSVLDGSLREVIGRADVGKTFWLAAAVPSELVAGSPGEGATDVVGSLELASGFALAVSVAFRSADAATEKRDELRHQLDARKGDAAGLGVSQAVVDSIAIEARGNTVALSMKMSDEDMKKLGSRLMSR